MVHQGQRRHQHLRTGKQSGGVAITVMTNTWPRGSEWRKWDLHLHAPGTKLNDQFKVDNGDVWDEYCRRLSESDVQVFGITDYFSADGYFSVREEFQKRYS